MLQIVSIVVPIFQAKLGSLWPYSTAKLEARGAQVKRIVRRYVCACTLLVEYNQMPKYAQCSCVGRLVGDQHYLQERTRVKAAPTPLRSRRRYSRESRCARCFKNQVYYQTHPIQPTYEVRTHLRTYISIYRQEQKGRAAAAARPHEECETRRADCGGAPRIGRSHKPGRV